MTRTIRVYYAGQLYREMLATPVFPMINVSKELREESLEIYNGAYCHVLEPDTTWFGTNWFRADGTPVLPQDVPKELKLLELLIN